MVPCMTWLLARCADAYISLLDWGVVPMLSMQSCYRGTSGAQIPTPSYPTPPTPHHHHGTAQVLSWCPKNNLFRKAIGSLKDKQDPIDLEVYPVKLASRGRLLVKL